MALRSTDARERGRRGQESGSHRFEWFGGRCVYGRGPILTRESIGSSDLFPVALVGCQCSCMASKRRASFIYFYQEKFSGDRSSPLDPMRPTQLDKGLIIQISGIGCKLSFFVFWWPFFFFFYKFNWRRKREKFKLAFCLFVESLSIIPKASAHTYLRYFVPTVHENVPYYS